MQFQTKSTTITIDFSGKNSHSHCQSGDALPKIHRLSPPRDGSRTPQDHGGFKLHQSCISGSVLWCWGLKVYIKFHEQQQNVSQASCSLQQVAFESSMTEYIVYIRYTVHYIYSIPASN